jgi:glycosyltransferase involved in cell wall biosynthesis
MGVTPIDRGGASSSGAGATQGDPAEGLGPLGRYFLAVGTIEPRKNYGIVLDAFEALRADHPAAGLVIVGRPGWHDDLLLERLRASPVGVTWRNDVSDGELDELYRGAQAVVVASVTEGFGLPVIEALAHGVPVLSSTGGSLPEAGGDLVEYFDPRSADELRTLMARHLDDADHHRRARARAATFQPTSWDESARAVAVALEQLAGLEQPPSLT